MAWTLRLPDDLEARLEGHCRDTAASKHGTVVLALEEWLDRHPLKWPVTDHATVPPSGKPFNGPDPRVKP